MTRPRTGIRHVTTLLLLAVALGVGLAALSTPAAAVHYQANVVVDHHAESLEADRAWATSGLEPGLDDRSRVEFADGLFFEEGAQADADATGAVTFGPQATNSTHFDLPGRSGHAVLVDAAEADVDSVIYVTYEENGNHTIAGDLHAGSDDLTGGEVDVALDDTGGFPGNHTVWLIPQDNVSDQGYEPGDVLSEETAAEALDTDTAPVYRGTVEFEDHSYEESTDEVEVATAALSDGEGDDTEFVVAIHETSDDGSALGAPIGTNGSLTGHNDNVTIALDDGTEIDATDEYIAALHSAEPPDDDPLATVIPHLEPGHLFDGGVNDKAEVVVHGSEGTVVDSSFSVVGGSTGIDVDNISLSPEILVEDDSSLLVAQLGDSTYDPGAPEEERIAQHRELANLGVTNETTFEIELAIEDFEPRMLLGAGNFTGWEMEDAGNNVTNVSITVQPIDQRLILNCTAYPSDEIGTCGPPADDWPDGDPVDDQATHATEVALDIGIENLERPNENLTEEEAAIRDLLNESHIATDAQIFGMPEYDPETGELGIFVAGPHNTTEGAQNVGVYEAFVPQTFIDDQWNGVSPDNLTAAFEGEARTIDVDPDPDVGDGYLITVDPMTYSAGNVTIVPEGDDGDGGGDGDDGGDDSGDDPYADIEDTSLNVDDDGVDLDNITLDAFYAGGMLQIQLANDTADANDLGNRTELAGLGATTDTEFDVAIDVNATNRDPPRVLIGAGNVSEWDVVENDDGTFTVSFTVRPLEVHTLFDCDLWEESGCAPPTTGPGSWPDVLEEDGVEDRATDSNEVAVEMAADPLSDLPSDRADTLDGMIIATNAQEFGFPQYDPGSDGDPPEISQYVAAPAKTVDGEDNDGFFEALLPNALLDDWGVTTPDALGANYDRGENIESLPVTPRLPDGTSIGDQIGDDDVVLDIDVHFSDGDVKITSEEGGDDNETEELSASFDHDPTDPLTDQAVTFNASNSTGQIEEYRWNSTDDPSINATTTDAELVHSFGDAGEYEVTLTVVDAEGNESTATVTVEVSARECFIATAAFGTPYADAIDVLRDYRDEVLLEHPSGEFMVNTYYAHSPPIADRISGNDEIRWVVRELFVKPLVELVSFGYELADSLATLTDVDAILVS